MAPAKHSGRGPATDGRRESNAAPKNHESPPRSGAPTEDDVRLALVHLAEVAAANEGWGLAVGAPSNVVDDRAFLAKITALILDHRREQRGPQREALRETLHNELGEEYRAYKNDRLLDRVDLEAKIRQVCHPLDIEPTDDELGELELARDGDPDAIKESGGPREAAKKALYRVMGGSDGDSARAFRDAWAGRALLVRRAFGRWVRPAVVSAYLHELANQPPATETKMVSLGDTSEAAGAVLDRAVERELLARFTSEPGIRGLLEEGRDDDELAAEFRAAFASATKGYHERMCAIAEELAKCDEFVEDRIWALASPSDAVKDATSALVDALSSPNEEALERAKRNLDEAIRAHLVALARLDFTNHVECRGFINVSVRSPPFLTRAA